MDVNIDFHIDGDSTLRPSSMSTAMSTSTVGVDSDVDVNLNVDVDISENIGRQ